jgi:vacuolar-type H+-ATPase subunit I/STV1
MSKYKNISGFKQYPIINGKRVCVNPDDIFESSGKINEPDIFEIVSDSEKITISSSSRKNNLSPINTQNINDIETKIKSLENDSQIMKSLKDDIDNKLQILEKIINDQNKLFNDFKDVTGKRLEIIKKAINNVEEDIDQLYQKGLLEGKE